MNYLASDNEFDILHLYDSEDELIGAPPAVISVPVPVSATMASNQVTIKTSVDLPVYSGHPVNT